VRYALVDALPSCALTGDGSDVERFFAPSSSSATSPSVPIPVSAET